MGRALVRAVAIWWRDIIDFALLNLVWLAFSLTVVGAAPALAAMHQVAANAVAGDYHDGRTFLRAMRRLAFPAWCWGLLQVVVYGIIGVNLWYYGPVEGTLMAVLRSVWCVGLVGWTSLNLLYWPFFLAQEDRSLRTTYRNALVMAVRRPLTLAGIALVTVLASVISVVTVIPLAFALAAWLALLSTVVVQGELENHRAQHLAVP